MTGPIGNTCGYSAPLACRQVEKTVRAGAAAVGATVAWTARPVWLWLVLAVLCAVATLIAGRRARHGWACPRAAHSADRPTSSGVVGTMPDTARRATEMPVAAVVVAGLPLVVRLVLDENGDTRTPWWPVPLLARAGSAAPGFPWLAALGALVILTGMDAARVPRGRAYLRALHTAGRTG